MKTLFDPACGTGGMLSVAEDYLLKLNPDARLEVFGQELNDETYAICRSDMMLKGQSASQIAPGNSFSEDGHRGCTFDYMLANPPFGVEWKNVEREIKDENETLGFRGRFGAGLPRINDGSFLFLQHMISKMKPVDQGGSRLAVVFNGSPLFTGAAGSGESEIRRWVIESDWLEGVVALPDQLFYNTGISTYFWVLTNRKSPERRGTVQLVDARELWVKMRKSLGEKRKQLSNNQIAEVTRLYGAFEECDRVRILPNEAFGLQRITVERPLRRRYTSVGASERLAASKAFAKLDDAPREVIASIIEGIGELSTTHREEALGAFALMNVKLSKAEERMLMGALAVRDPEAPAVLGKDGAAEPDPELRDHENVPTPLDPVSFESDPTDRLATEPYRHAVDVYLEAEVLPYISGAWVDHARTRIGYEIPLARHFYRYVAPRPLLEIDDEIRELENQIRGLLSEAEANRDVLFAGLDGAVGCRDTGASWLPKVPAHWRASKLSYVGEIRSGATPSTDRSDYWNGDIPWVSPKDMKRFEIAYTEDLTTRNAVDDIGLSVIQPGGVLFVVRGMILAHTFPVALNTVERDHQSRYEGADDVRG